ncbi:glycosyltransferase family 4 protein [Verrucomicrobiota bacterium sgz303538]
MKVTLASLDLFHIVNQARCLQQAGVLEHYFASRVREYPEGIQAERCTSCYPLHYGVRLLQRWPKLVGGNHFYLQLCRAFDAWLRMQFPRQTDILTVLSGVGLHSMRKARDAGILTVVDCGSTHTDAQHELVSQEYARNGLSAPLFPEGYRDRVRREFEEADYILLPSRFVIRTFLERGIPESKILQAEYGVDLEVFKPSDTPPADRPFRVVCSSGVNLRKGARVLVEAWRKLGWSDAELHWVGRPGPETQHLFLEPLKGLVWEPFLSHRDLAQLYRSCDVLVLPSFEEGLARVLLEGAACGLPLIATPNTGIEDFFTPGDPEGWLIQANSVDALCEALSAAKKDRDRTSAMGSRAAQRAKAFSWDAYGERVLANYRGILRKAE